MDNANRAGAHTVSFFPDVALDHILMLATHFQRLLIPTHCQPALACSKT